MGGFELGLKEEVGDAAFVGELLGQGGQERDVGGRHGRGFFGEEEGGGGIVGIGLVLGEELGMAGSDGVGCLEERRGGEELLGGGDGFGVAVELVQGEESEF